jgi:hypothetical protein
VEDGAYAKRVGAQLIGLVSEVINETKAWHVEMPDGTSAWAAEIPMRAHCEDARGRTILIVPRWPASKIGLRATS